MNAQVKNSLMTIALVIAGLYVYDNWVKGKIG